MKSGFISIAGLANAGKSTLINALVGEKVAIVSFRPQTTRNRILGIKNGDGYQIAFVDTPGIHKSFNKLGDYMQKSVDYSIREADGVIYVVDATRGLESEDINFLTLEEKNRKIVVALNKQDAVKKERLFSILSELNEIKTIVSVVPISAKKEQNLNTLLSEILKLLPKGEKLFPDDMYTDKSINFIIGEIVREKALHLLDKEIPYGIGTETIQCKQREDSLIYDVAVDIVCEKTSHKAIIIGKGGSMLKEIASRARYEIEQLLSSKVFLKVFVKVREDWRESEYLMKELGYNKKDF